MICAKEWVEVLSYAMGSIILAMIGGMNES